MLIQTMNMTCIENKFPGWRVHGTLAWTWCDSGNPAPCAIYSSFSERKNTKERNKKKQTKRANKSFYLKFPREGPQKSTCTLYTKLGGNIRAIKKMYKEGQRTRSGPELRRNGRFDGRPKSGFLAKKTPKFLARLILKKGTFFF